LARDLTGGLLGIALKEIPADDTASWDFTRLVGPSSRSDDEGVSSLANTLHLNLIECLGHSDAPEIGLPVVVVAMTAAEAADLLIKPPEPVAALLEHVGGFRVIALRLYSAWIADSWRAVR
jgi:hypothetical protein